MTTPCPTRVAVLAEPELAARLLRDLAAEKLAVCAAGNAFSAGEVDCLLSDRPLEQLPEPWQAAVCAQRVAFVTLASGTKGAQDDNSDDDPLPCEVSRSASPQMLSLACRIWTRHVRLRRQLAAASRVLHDSVREARTDPLTGLGNRRMWEEELSPRVRQALDSAQSACVAIFDIDWFKAVNDEHGHAVGDRVLACCGEALRAATRPGDLLCRLGGDEFALLLAEVPSNALAGVIERIRTAPSEALANADLPLVTLSAGYARSDEPEASAPGAEAASELPLQMLADADSALRQAKRLGRNCAVAAKAS